MTNIKTLITAFALGLIFTTGTAVHAHHQTNSMTTQEKIADHILRLHILANSDGPQDQAIKMLVKEEVLAIVAEVTRKTTDITQVHQVVTRHLEDITAAANHVLVQQGQAPSANAHLAQVYFPEITYGDMTLPSGYYHALQVSIGLGIGANWWCVMFPMLCFLDEATGEPTPYMRALLRNVLDEEEYEKVFNIRFRTAEWLRLGN